MVASSSRALVLDGAESSNADGGPLHWGWSCEFALEKAGALTACLDASGEHAPARTASCGSLD